MTAKLQELWEPVAKGPGVFQVTPEDLRHMQSRVHQFTARHQIAIVMQLYCSCTAPRTGGH